MLQHKRYKNGVTGMRQIQTSVRKTMMKLVNNEIAQFSKGKMPVLGYKKLSFCGYDVVNVMI